MMTEKPTEHVFFQFIYRRHLIWYKRFVLKQDYPWTDDPILQQFKFINMYRELDKCTLYILNKLKDIHNRKTLLLNIIFYRFFNRSQLYEELDIEPFFEISQQLKDNLIETLTALQKKKPIFNDAYLICSGGKGVKHVNILNSLAALSVDRLIIEIDCSQTPEESHTVLAAIPLIGPFLACEIWTDLVYFNFFKQGWNDNDFVNIGPGAKWGLEILYGELLKHQLKNKLYHLYQLQGSILSTVPKHLGEKLSWKEIAYKQAYSSYPFLSITNIEGALCEFRKYWNLSHGKGKRRYFTPPLSQEGLR